MTEYLDYKATIWFRIPLDSKETIKAVIKKLEQGFLPPELYDDPDIYPELGQCEPLYDVEESMHPTENGGQSTVEIYDGEELIWDNSIKTGGKNGQ